MASSKTNTAEKLTAIEWDRVQIVRRIEWLCALAIMALLVFLHVYRASRGGALWRDEVSTLATSTMPSFSGLWSSQIYSRPPVLPYLVVRIWTGIKWFGNSDASWHALGALTGVGILLVMWCNSWLLGYRIPLLSLVLFGLNPYVIQWGDSPRGYGLGSLLILLVYGLVWKVVESPTTKRIIFAAFAAILSVQCLFQNAPLLFAICLGGSLVCLRMRMWKRMLVVLGIGATAAVTLAPYLPIIRAYQSGNVINQTIVDFPWILTVLALTFSAFDSIDFLFFPWFICCVIAAVAASYLISAKQKDRSGEGKVNLAIFSLTVLISGIVAFMVFSKAAGLEIHPWHCVPIVILMVLSIEVLIELATTTIPERLARLVVTILVAGVMIPFTWKQVPIRQTNIDVIATMLQKRASQRDFVVVNPWFAGITFQHYYRGETAWATAPPIQDLAVPRSDLLKEQMELEKPLQPVFDAMEKALRSGNRVWVVGDLAARPDGSPPPSLPPAPNGPGGWWSGDYKDAWTLQLGYFIGSHAVESEQINLQITQPVIPYENPSLQVFKGWRP